MRAVIGINPGVEGFNYHDPAAVLVAANRVLAALEEERITRIKSSAGIFPRGAVELCISMAEQAGATISEVAVGYSPERAKERLIVEATVAQQYEGSSTVRVVKAALEHGGWAIGEGVAERIRAYLPTKIRDLPISFVDHHLAHAASAFLPSGFRAATVVVIDGVGEVTTASLWLGKDGQLQLLHEYIMPNSLGYLYAAITKYLGFEPWQDEGKVMALAPYGQVDSKIMDVLSELCVVTSDGWDVTSFIGRCVGDGLSLNTRRACAILAAALDRPPRSKSDSLERFHVNVACCAQTLLERAIVAYVRRGIAMTGERNVCVAGGVFQNCKANQIVRELPEVAGFYAQPVSRDSGVALGAALIRSGVSTVNLDSLALGASFERSELREALRTWGIRFEEPENPHVVVAELLASGKVVLYAHGREEFGPRALGHRSVIADPRRRDLADYVNECVKGREKWRPLAPAILEEMADTLLEGYTGSKSAAFMIESYRVKPAWREALAGVIHPSDYTARPQIVRRDAEPEFHALIRAFHAITGVPAVLNTSLNGRGEPIAHSIKDIIGMFYTCGAHALLIEGLLVRK